MNIFWLDYNSKNAARYHNDKHVVKMILESAQLLSTAHHVLDGGNAIPNIYKATHINHPCAKWVRESEFNYSKLWMLAYELCMEYRHRYGKVHKSEEMIIRLALNPLGIPNIPATDPPLGMPSEYQTTDVVESYRNYYRGHKRHIAVWTNREQPYWWY